MDKLILAFYLGFKNADYEEVGPALEALKAGIKSYITASDILFFILPDFDMTAGSIKMDCLNPKILDKDKLNVLGMKLDNLNTKLDKNFKINFDEKAS